MAQSSIHKIDLLYDRNNSDASATRLLYTALPEWELEEGELEIKTFTQGITNIMMQAKKSRPGATDAQIEAQSVIVRVFGEGTEKLVDRERELTNHTIFADYGLAPEILAQFKNGLIYRFTPGKPCQREDLPHKSIYTGIARTLGQWHAVLPSKGDRVGDEASDATGERQTKSDRAAMVESIPSIWAVMRSWGNNIPDSPQRKELKRVLLGEVERAEREFGEIRGLDQQKLILAHCDLLPGNVIILPSSFDGASPSRGSPSASARAALIDYELSCFAPPAFDLALHFSEWPGFELDYSFLPSQNTRRAFIRAYVESYLEHASVARKTRVEADFNSVDLCVEFLMKQVDRLRGLPGLWWALGIQAHDPDDEKVKEFGKGRLEEWWGIEGGKCEGDRSSLKIREREDRWWKE
ncbi:MAG: hypothetical protein M1820_005580 [Bogoriella megaspora]|nr:MAG: hypothetical protein M1820_005580 [Bogoriella megaspora]